MFKMIISGGLLFVLTACANHNTYWEKPNANQAEWEQTKATCMLEGANKVAVAPTYTMQPGSAYTSNSCDKHGKNCSTYDTFTPPTMQQQDANAPLRDQVIRACLSRNDWVEKRQ